MRFLCLVMPEHKMKYVPPPKSSFSPSMARLTAALPVGHPDQPEPMEPLPQSVRHHRPRRWRATDFVFPVVLCGQRPLQGSGVREVVLCDRRTTASPIPKLFYWQLHRTSGHALRSFSLSGDS